jgi:glycosyltransferase involved in cell wall biosynthesis
VAIRYSIVIPTFNRAQQLQLTLVSFETQTYPKHLFEVIVVDDGSTDGTKEMVEGFQASYPLIYISHQEQRGRSAVRNLGLLHAKGLYVIFCDADFMVLPEFIRIVSRYQRKYPKAVISGFPYSWDNAYTHYHPDFSPEEKEQLRNKLTQSNLWRAEFETANEVLPLITPDDILHQTDALSKVIIPPRIPPNIIKQFAKTDVTPWMLLVTRCVSIRRNYLTRIGGFNERFVLYGLEDWDLGYRLHRLKIPIISIKNVVGYHQEHPTSFRGNLLNTENLKIMFDSYGFNDSTLNLFTLVPPWEDLVKYKHTLRVLRRGIRHKSTRSTALLLRRTIRIAAKQFFQQNNIQAYKQTLGWIRKKTKNRRSRVAHVLRDMLLRSEKLIE